MPLFFVQKQHPTGTAKGGLCALNREREKEGKRQAEKDWEREGGGRESGHGFKKYHSVQMTHG